MDLLISFVRHRPTLQFNGATTMFQFFNKIQTFAFIAAAILAVFAICYYAEHDRTILLLGVYPACVFTLLGFVAWTEAE